MSRKRTSRLKIRVRYTGRGKKKIALESRTQRKQKHK